MKVTTLQDMLIDRHLHKAAPNDTVRTACIMMSSANIGALPVIDEHGFLVGMISERDVIKRSVIVYRPSEETPVSQIMTRDPKWLPPEADVHQAIKTMRDGGFRHLPVCEGGRLVGVLSIRDFDLQQAASVVPVARRTVSRRAAL